jgi:hypothetical protein
VAGFAFPEEPMPAGRPTSYRPEFCDDVIELGKQGKSLAQMCAHFDIARQTIDNWAEQHPEFLEALSRAKVHCQAWWEDKGMDGLAAGKLNAPVWKKSMEARFRDDYTERREISGGVAVILSKDDADL